MNHTNFIENSKKKNNLPTKQCNVTNNGKKNQNTAFHQKKKKVNLTKAAIIFIKVFFTTAKNTQLRTL